MRPKTMRRRRKSTEHIWADTSKCQACWTCVDECEYGVLGKMDLWFHKHVVIKHAENCRGCQRCVDVCPNGVFKPVIQTPTEVNH